MKLSLSWIFDHINADWKSIPVEEIIKKINSITAEIEAFKKIDIDVKNFELAKVKEVNDKISLSIVDLNKTIELSNRLDAKEGDLFLVKKIDDKFAWVTLVDLGSEKEGLVPDLCIPDISAWRSQLETQDYILELDNKSITNRPDLWGHRGFAREIAAIFNLPLKPLDNFIIKPNIIESEELIENGACKKFATYSIPEIKIQSSSLFMAARLAKIDSRPINLVVDTTNYVMFDISQPMHAFDANKISQKIGPRFAKVGEKITLLDNETIELTAHDLVIADAQKPVALAGIMGGINSEVDNNTTALLIESANFDSATIRKTSTIVKKRTEASARFEKSLDPEQNILAIERFIKILSMHHINISNNPIQSFGIKTEPTILKVAHEFIEKRLGTKLTETFIIETLEKLEFLVKKIDNKIYEITVPSFRATKDITIPEDIVEEIGRFFGYANIEFVLPAKQIKPNSLFTTRRLRKIKQYLAFGAHMHEVQNYPFYDENFIKELNWQPLQSTRVASPVSENWVRLVDSLIPHLLKNIQQNLLQPQKLRFFEINNIWDTISKTTAIEKKSLAGIFFDKKNPVNFYECKENLNGLFTALGFDNIKWQKTENNSPWYSQYQTAELFYNDTSIGHAGMVSQSFLEKISEGSAFIFELDAQFLLQEQAPEKRFKNISKYPSVWLDISLLLPSNITVRQVTDIIAQSDAKIYKVELVDHFENPDWDNKKSLTLRYYLVDENKTLSKEEIDAVINKVSETIKTVGAQIR
ncbi:MAG: phenylalanine--tRNA ligase subunit beta [Candidatus Babeliales bacterium]|nr:phenylalanine--tRNA ligase subunit beta [Candidatus Babeliales bacterium]